MHRRALIRTERGQGSEFATQVSMGSASIPSTMSVYKSRAAIARTRSPHAKRANPITHSKCPQSSFCTNSIFPLYYFNVSLSVCPQRRCAADISIVFGKRSFLLICSMRLFCTSPPISGHRSNVHPHRCHQIVHTIRTEIDEVCYCIWQKLFCHANTSFHKYGIELSYSEPYCIDKIMYDTHLCACATAK